MEDNLKFRLENLDISVVEGVDGRFAAFSESEPLFFVARDTVEELNALVTGIITDYAERFHEKKNIKVFVEEQKRSAPIEVKRVSRLSPRVELAYA